MLFNQREDLGQAKVADIHVFFIHTWEAEVHQDLTQAVVQTFPCGELCGPGASSLQQLPATEADDGRAFPSGGSGCEQLFWGGEQRPVFDGAAEAEGGVVVPWSDYRTAAVHVLES